MKLKKNSTEQKLRGAYYTPELLSRAIISLFQCTKRTVILEPSCGDGVFLDAIVAENTDDCYQITAVELDSAESKKVSKKFSDNKSIEVINQDFFDFYKNHDKQKKYDLVLGNPPYIRYQYLTESQREVQSKILTENGMKSNKLINAWVCFLVACTRLLNDNGKIAFIIPAEILQVAYAEDLRLFLSAQFSKITLITFEKLVFPVEQEVIVFIGEKGEVEKGIRIIEMNDINCFKHLDLEANGFQALGHVKEKWTKYFISASEGSIINSIRSDKRFIEFSSCGVINVGVTTGNNDYFSIDKDTEAKFGLENVTLPLIGRSSHAHGIFFTSNDHEINFEIRKKAKLLTFSNVPYEEYPPPHKEYIAKGEKEEQNIGYKCSIRDRWYIVPSIWIPDAFFLRRSNLYPKFMLNTCGAISTDTMHRIKFHDNIIQENILLSYYNSITFAFTEICGRSYGGGVLEILPREMGSIMLPKIENISLDIRDTILQQIDNIVRNNKNIEEALELVDNEVLVDLLGIEKQLCVQCRSIWKKMSQRRLKRTTHVK